MGENGGMNWLKSYLKFFGVITVWDILMLPIVWLAMRMHLPETGTCVCLGIMGGAGIIWTSAGFYLRG